MQFEDAIAFEEGQESVRLHRKTAAKPEPRPAPASGQGPPAIEPRLLILRRLAVVLQLKPLLLSPPIPPRREIGFHAKE